MHIDMDKNLDLYTYIYIHIHIKFIHIHALMYVMQRNVTQLTMWPCVYAANFDPDCQAFGRPRRLPTRSLWMTTASTNTRILVSSVLTFGRWDWPRFDLWSVQVKNHHQSQVRCPGFFGALKYQFFVFFKNVRWIFRSNESWSYSTNLFQDQKAFFPLEWLLGRVVARWRATQFLMPGLVSGDWWLSQWKINHLGNL